MSKENLFSGLNNPIVNSVLDEKYSKYFGFTVDEVNTMASYYGQVAKLEELREWYDGYRFGSTEIYNPWSVANYFIMTVRRNHIGPIPVIMRSSGRS